MAIALDDVRIAAFRFRAGCTAIVKKTKAGHFFLNIYRHGRKVSSRYERVAGVSLAKGLGIEYSELNFKLYLSTLNVQIKKMFPLGC